MVHHLSTAYKVSIGLLTIFLLILIQPLKAQYIPPPTNLQTEIIGSNTNKVFVSWDLDYDTTLSFQFYIVRRDSAPLATSTCNVFIDNLLDTGTYCYTVSAFCNEGVSEWAGPSCEDIVPVPEMIIIPSWIEDLVPLNTPNWNPGTFMGVQNNGGVDLNYEVLGFTGPTPPPGFITEVTFASGLVTANGGLVNCGMTWSSVGYSPGTYNQDLVVVSDDPFNPVDLVPTIMHVGPLSFIIGDIADAISLDSLHGVRISGAGQHTQTDANGYYSFRVPVDTTFELTLEKPGYETLTIRYKPAFRFNRPELGTC